MLNQSTCVFVLSLPDAAISLSSPLNSEQETCREKVVFVDPLWCGADTEVGVRVEACGKRIGSGDSTPGEHCLGSNSQRDIAADVVSHFVLTVDDWNE